MIRIVLALVCALLAGPATGQDTTPHLVAWRQDANAEGVYPEFWEFQVSPSGLPGSYALAPGVSPSDPCPICWIATVEAPFAAGFVRSRGGLEIDGGIEWSAFSDPLTVPEPPPVASLAAGIGALAWLRGRRLAPRSANRRPGNERA